MATEQELQTLFNTLDTDKDGKVSIHELLSSTGLSGFIAAEADVDNPQELIATYGGADGSITFENLKQAFEKAGSLD